MAKLTAIYTPSTRLQSLGAPKYINSKPINLPTDFVVFNENETSKNLISKTDQINYLDVMMTSNPGWLCYLCGDYAKIKTLSIHLMERYNDATFGFKTPHSEWLYLTNYGLKYNSKSDLCVIDAFTMHDGQIDVTSTRRLFEFVVQNRAKRSIMVLCPTINPSTIGKYLIENPEFILLLK